MTLDMARMRHLLQAFTAGMLVSLLTGGPALAQMGHVLEAVGPVNQSMGGAATALPLDAMGALQWNPASITAIEGSEIGFAFTALAPKTTLSSSFGPFSGSTESDIDINPMPAFAFVYSPDDSPWSYGLGGSAIAGFGVDYAATEFPPTDPSNTNIILAPQPFGFGAVYSTFQMMQISPTVACRVTDRLSVGIAPTFDWTSLGVDPWPASPPNGDGTYSGGSHADSRWGMGLKIGVFWEDACSGWKLGASYKTTDWIDEYKHNSQDENGNPRVHHFNMDYPSILSLGVGYTGIECWDFALDVRYISYSSTDGFQASGFDPTGAVRGFGWDSIWTASMGVQYHVSETFRLRGGYTFNESPIGGEAVFFNIQAPAIVQNHLSAGFSWDLPHRWTLAMAYTYGFENGVSGPMSDGDGPIAGSSVTSELGTQLISGGISVKF